jgi:hypothetical protein
MEREFFRLRIGVFSAPSRSIGDEPLTPSHRPFTGVPFLARPGPYTEGS